VSCETTAERNEADCFPKSVATASSNGFSLISWCTELGAILRFKLPNHSRPKFFVNLNSWTLRKETASNSLICWACCRPTTTPHSHTRPSHCRGRCSVGQITGISVAAEFENFVQSEPGKMKVVFRVLREAVRIFLC
jgi:hypothetical protein